jgi:hypothetical protein
MRQKPAHGARELENMGDMEIIAWCAKGMEALWWPNPHVNAPNARGVVKIQRVNMLTVAKPAKGPAGRTC